MAADAPPWLVQVALSRASATALGLRPGDLLTMKDQQGRPVAARVSGISVASDPGDLYTAASDTAFSGDRAQAKIAVLGAIYGQTSGDGLKNLAMLRDALYAVTGRRLIVETVVGAPPEPTEPEDARELSEEDVISLLKDTFDAEEVEEH